MSRESEISVTERQILDLIKFRSNERHRFFGSNDYIAECLTIKEKSAKNMVNKLVRLGYLNRVMEGKKRYLHYTGKEYKPIIGDLSNYDKARLKQEVAHYQTEYKDAEQLIELLNIEIAQLKANKLTLEQSIRVYRNILLQFGMTEEQEMELFSKVYAEMFGG